jgi:hypothetical protein
VTVQFSFDTLAFVKRLSAAGWDTRQAEALAEALTGNAFDELATKSDLRELGSALRSETKELELRLTIRTGAMIAAAVAILGALITFS